MSSFFQDFLASLLCFEPFGAKFNMISGTLLRESMSNSICNSTESSSELCRDDSAALILKLVAFGSILVAGVVGIAIPLLGRRKRFLSTDGNLFIAAKAFAAGVILATGFVHMLPDGSKNLTNSCLPKYPWHKFPFSGFFSMMAALVTLLVDFLGTQLYERKREKIRREEKGPTNEFGLDGSLDSMSAVGVLPADRPTVRVKDGKVFGGEESIVGIHAHSRAHGHGHDHGHAEDSNSNGALESHEGHVVQVDIDEDDGHGHLHGFGGGTGARHAVVSQVLELGIISHSVLIGLSLGVSHSPCTIRPLIGALSFHQFFEGFALGGCIAQAQFRKISTIFMACFFALTTPAGIAVGIAVASSYNPASMRALLVEGILDSISSGILIYMALVDLIAADFMSKRMRCNMRLQIVSYAALFLGATLMAGLAMWS